MTAVFALPGVEQATPSPFDYVVDTVRWENEAVSPSGRIVQERRRARRDRASAAQYAYRLWNIINDLVDDVDERLLATLMVRPDIGIAVIHAGHLLMAVIPNVHSFSVRPLEEEDELEDLWFIVAKVPLPPEDAFERLNKFDRYWQAYAERQELDHVIATVEFV